MTTHTEADEFTSQDEYETLDNSDNNEDNAANFNPFKAVQPDFHNSKTSSKHEQMVKCCYENQRYWLMGGWSTQMGGNLERAAWSDAKGLFYLPKKSIKLEKGWGWTGNWMVEGRDVRGSQSLQDGIVDHDGTYDK